MQRIMAYSSSSMMPSSSMHLPPHHSPQSPVQGPSMSTLSSSSLQASSAALKWTFWWLWTSMFGTVVVLVLLRSWTAGIPCLASSACALRRLLNSQVVIGDDNDWDLEMQPLEQAGVIPQRRNLTLLQALRLAFLAYMQGR